MVPGALGAGQKLPKIDQFSKIFFSTTTHVEEKLNTRVLEKCRFYQFGRQKIEMSDIKGLLIGPNVRHGKNHNI
jgi:hypothetical protein